MVPEGDVAAVDMKQALGKFIGPNALIDA